MLWCRGATYDYCVQALGCTAEEATKAEGALLPNIAESMTRTQAEDWCGLAAVLARPERRGAEESGSENVSARCWASVEYSMAPKLDWLQERLDLDDAH